jgi:hypothetical protein
MKNWAGTATQRWELAGRRFPQRFPAPRTNIYHQVSFKIKLVTHLAKLGFLTSRHEFTSVGPGQSVCGGEGGRETGPWKWKKGGEGKTTMQGGEVRLFLTRGEQSDLLCAGMTKKHSLSKANSKPRTEDDLANSGPMKKAVPYGTVSLKIRSTPIRGGGGCRADISWSWQIQCIVQAHLYLMK